MIQTNCRVCGQDLFSKWGERNGYNLYQCKNCELVFFYPYPSKDELDAFYNTKYHTERGYGGQGETGVLRRKMYKQDISALERELSDRGRFLDVGCAEGVFLSMMSDQWEKYGIDVSESAVSKACQKEGITAEVNDITDMENGFFNVIHLRGVFEHLLYPLDFANQANMKLKATGTLVLSNTPNIGGIVPKLFRGRFKLVLPNEHVNYYSIKTIKVLAQKTSFLINKVSYPYFGTPYCSFWKNLFEIPFSLLTGKLSPPFWKNIFTVYLRKMRNV